MPSLVRFLLLAAGVALSLAAQAAVPAGTVAPAAGRADPGRQDVLVWSSRQAVARLSRKGGFSADPRLRLGLPPALRDAERLLRKLGANKETEEFLRVLNDTAEVLAGRAEPLLLAAAREVQAGPGAPAPRAAVFRAAREAALLARLLPIARELTEGELIDRVYRRVVKQSARFGYLRGEAPALEHYLAERTLDGLFIAMAEAEQTLPQGRAGLMAGVAVQAPSTNVR